MSRLAAGLMLGAVLTPVAATTGCAGARVNITAERARFPISMSDAVRDKSGELYGPPSFQRLGTFSVEATKIGILYSAVAPGSPLDISDAVNSQVTAVQGEAVIRLSVTVSEGCAFLNSFPVLNALPIWPGCVPITIEGEIVRRRPKPPAAQQSGVSGD
ncbi:MAG TPA: hypothetical protein VKQ32_04830 [Polyangia bacterium]|nr:hypothetical protein [Polyangia bacterium]